MNAMSPNTREDSRGFTELSVSERIRILASQGLKARDISSMLHIHPQIVIRELTDNNNNETNT